MGNIAETSKAKTLFTQSILDISRYMGRLYEKKDQKLFSFLPFLSLKKFPSFIISFLLSFSPSLLIFHHCLFISLILSLFRFFFLIHNPTIISDHFLPWRFNYSFSITIHPLSSSLCLSLSLFHFFCHDMSLYSPPVSSIFYFVSFSLLPTLSNLQLAV